MSTQEFQRVKYLVKFLQESYKEMTYKPRKPDYNAKESAESQAGRVWIITGSTSGIGFEAACQLAELGAHVWLTGRNESKAKEHVDLLKKRVGSTAKVDYLLLDFADLATIKPGIKPFLDSGSALHGIIHNAGVMFTPSTAKTAQGHEMQLGTNNLAPWLLQKYLNPVLLKSTKDIQGRIVWVSSLAHVNAPYSGDIIAETPLRIGAHIEAYSQSKAIDAMESIQWSKIHPDANVKSIAVHPGIIKTNLTREMSGFATQMFLKTAWPVEYGAASELAAALFDFPNNTYVIPFGRVGTLRPDIRAAAEKDLKLSKWLDEQVKDFL